MRNPRMFEMFITTEGVCRNGLNSAMSAMRGEGDDQGKMRLVRSRVTWGGDVVRWRAWVGRRGA